MIKKPILLLFCFSFLVVGFRQPGIDTAWKKLYRASYPRVNDFIHTKLKVTFDYQKARMNGEAWITLKPHFYPTDSLSLDAKQMDISRVAILRGNSFVDQKYDYDGWHLKIKLGRLFHSSEQYTVYI